MPSTLESRFLPVVLIAFATLIGGFVRFAAMFAVDFPLNDGGLFYALIQALQANHYNPPLNYEYNGMLLPFAYPPLGFYFTGFTSDLLHQSLLEVMRWLPPLVSTLTIPAFYIFARSLLPSRMTAVLGAFAFALLPRGFDWLIMGGGITRSFGYLFAILRWHLRKECSPTPKPVMVLEPRSWHR